MIMQYNLISLICYCLVPESLVLGFELLDLVNVVDHALCLLATHLQKIINRFQLCSLKALFTLKLFIGNGLPRHGFDLGSRSQAAVSFSVALCTNFIIFRPAGNQDRSAWNRGRPNGNRDWVKIMNLDFRQCGLDFRQGGLDFQQVGKRLVQISDLTRSK